MFTMPSSADSTAALEQLLADIFAYDLSVDPVKATLRGKTGNNHKLADNSPAALALSSQQYRQFLQQLHRIDYDTLPRFQQISYKVQEYYLQNNIDRLAFNAHYVPFTSESGFFSRLRFLTSIHQFRAVQDYRDYLARLEQFPAYFKQQIYWLRQGIKAGMTQPKVVLDGLPEIVAEFYAGPVEKSHFYRPFISLTPMQQTTEQELELRQQATSIIENKVFAAYRSFNRFLIEEYIPKAKTDISIQTWPSGKAYYQNRIRHFTTVDMTAAEIHQLGLAEVQRIRSEMQAVITSVDFDGDLQAFIQYLRTDPQFYATSERELLRYTAYLSKRIDGMLPKLFSHLPKRPYGIRPVPASIAPKYTTGRYIPPTNDTEAGYYWVNTYALDKRPLYALPALTLHEAVPGHHLQIALSYELENTPPVRRYGYISAFGEGWGLYAEFLGKEVGFYETPYDEFGRLSYEMWRAARLVVDTGMHSKGWSRKQAIDFMMDNTALSELNIISEIDRYISWPGQALAYKIGELTIKRLRRQAESALGDKFDIREFHRILLEHGSIPLAIVEDNVRLYIEEVKNS